MSVADQVGKLERRIERLESENERLDDRLAQSEGEAEHYERQLRHALDQIEQLEDDHAAANAKPFRPDRKRIDAGDWTHAMSSCVCETCGYQFWEHPTVPGYAWMHRICDGRLVKL